MARFHFVVPVRSKKTAGNRWFAAKNPDGGSIESTLDLCLSSLFNQTARDFVVHVICHEPPPFHIQERWPDVEIVDVPQDGRVKADRYPTRSHPALFVHRVNFPRPGDMDLKTYNRLSGKLLRALPDVQRQRVGDKYNKFKVGLSAGLDDPDSRFLMLVDADDLIHRDVVGYSLQHDGEAPGGHTVTSGYAWKLGEDSFRELKGFFRQCGSCNVVGFNDEDKQTFAEHRDCNAFRNRPKHLGHWLFAGHAGVSQTLRKNGRMTEKLPFHAAVYVTGSGLNISGTKRQGSGDVPLTPELRAQFGLV